MENIKEQIIEALQDAEFSSTIITDEVLNFIRNLHTDLKNSQLLNDIQDEKINTDCPHTYTIEKKPLDVRQEKWTYQPVLTLMSEIPDDFGEVDSTIVGDYSYNSEEELQHDLTILNERYKMELTEI